MGDGGSRAKAVLFDVDGTLYYQLPVRCFVALELAVLPLRLASWQTTQRTWRILRTFRRLREEMREWAPAPREIERLQYIETAQRAGASVEEVERVVAEWMFRRPLRYLRLARRRGVLESLQALHRHGVRLGVFSDYPCEDKLTALRIRHLFSMTICATDSDVDALKPHPVGFLVACQRWGLDTSAVLYVGDRPEVDAAGAEAAGMRCIIVGATTTVGRNGMRRNYTPLFWFRRLPRAVIGAR